MESATHLPDHLFSFTRCVSFVTSFQNALANVTLQMHFVKCLRIISKLHSLCLATLSESISIPYEITRKAIVL